VRENVKESSRNLDGIETEGVSILRATERLLDDGVAKFEASFVELLQALRDKVRDLGTLRG